MKLKIGILGGTRGLDFLSRVLMHHPYASVTDICESFSPLADRIRNECQLLGNPVHVHTDFEEMLQSGIDAVIIANFANAHARFAIRALRAGVHVLSESIPTQTMHEAVELCEAVESSGKIYVYGENYCYLPHILQMRDILQSGELGEIMHAEGNFINDCSFKWHLLTRGARAHWRNHVPSTFYCTHSIGPLLFSTGRRAERVVGMETPRMPYMAEVGARSGSAAMEIMQLDNGGMAKSINGNYRRQYNAEYRFLAEKGTLETDPYQFETIHLFTPKENGSYAERAMTVKAYSFPHVPIHATEDFEKLGTFPLADVYLLNLFIQSIMGNEEANRYIIDVYRALDMSTVGILAFRSILNGSQPFRIPNLRVKEDRDIWRNDHCSTDPEVSTGDALLPSSRDGFAEVPDVVYERVAAKFKAQPVSSGSH